MSVYANIGGGSKQLTSLYFNKDGTRKSLTNAYANINGTSKEIFAATKRHWWKRYKINNWTYAEGTSFYDSDLDSSNETNNVWLKPDSTATHYVASSANINSSAGVFSLSGTSRISWTEGTNPNGKIWTTTDSGWISRDSTNGYSNSAVFVLHITGGTILKLYFSSGAEQSGISVKFDRYRYRVPAGYSSNYVLGYTSYYYSSYPPYCDSDSDTGPWDINQNYYIDSNGYAYMNNQDDRDTTYYKSYQDYRWEYDGYHA